MRITNGIKKAGLALGLAGMVVLGGLSTMGQVTPGPPVGFMTSFKNTGPAYETGVISPTDTGTQNNYAPTGIGTARRIRLNPGSSLTVTGLRCSASADCAAADDGRELEVCNVAAQAIVLSSDSGSSTAANRIYTTNQGSIIFPSSSASAACAILRYDGASLRWRVVAFSSGQFNGLNTSGNLTVSGTAHLRSTGTSPTLSSCGTSPSIAGGDNAFRVTIGTSASNACTMTFSATYTNAPSCIVYPEGAAAATQITTSATAIVFGGTVTDSGVYHVHCHGVI